MTYPNKTLPADPAFDRQKLNTWLDAALAALLALTVFSLPGSHGPGGHGWGAVHCLAGTLLVLGCALHLALHRRWVQAVALGRASRLKPAVRRSRSLFFGLLAALFTCGLSGLLHAALANGPTHLLLPLALLWGAVHVLSGLVFLGVSACHLALHRQWIISRVPRS